MPEVYIETAMISARQHIDMGTRRQVEHGRLDRLDGMHRLSVSAIHLGTRVAAAALPDDDHPGREHEGATLKSTASK